MEYSTSLNLSGHCVFFCLRVLIQKVHYYCAELQLESEGDKTQATLLRGPTYPGILSLHIPDTSWFSYQQDAQALGQSASI